MLWNYREQYKLYEMVGNTWIKHKKTKLGRFALMVHYHIPSLILVLLCGAVYVLMHDTVYVPEGLRVSCVVAELN